MTAAVLTIGTELLRGRIVNTNAAWISQRLTELGIDVVYQATVGDHLDEIVDVLQRAGAVSKVVIVTGGLGPTQDDLARESLAELTDRPLEEDPEAVAHLKAFFARRGYNFTGNNVKQATRPRGAELLENVCGTAPGVYLEHEGVVYIAVPGPPTEMHEMMERHALPRILGFLGEPTGHRLLKRLRLCDVGESSCAQILEDVMRPDANPLVCSYASPGEVVLEITARAETEAEAEAMLAARDAEIRERLPGNVYATGDDGMEAALGLALREQGKTITTAESCTGGLIASRITDVSGASEYFLQGIVSYSNDAKMRLLGVPAELLAEHGAVSGPVARAMVEGAREVAGADFAIAVTGIAGPTGGTDEKPVGLVYIAVGDESGAVVEEYTWPGTRYQFKQRVSQTALNMARKRVLGAAPEEDKPKPPIRI
ncbi:MAG TPA: competence/damage-inducible protein A [Armatimonadota bacterium]|nr:competence/damage-inducible protein A [Armatimonadota bacterium]